MPQPDPRQALLQGRTLHRCELALEIHVQLAESDANRDPCLIASVCFCGGVLAANAHDPRAAALSAALNGGAAAPTAAPAAPAVGVPAAGASGPVVQGVPVEGSSLKELD